MENPGSSASRNEMVPFYFRASPERLYGCHHRPGAATGKGFAVVLCPAIGQEYLQSHRTIYRLAVLLSESGFHALRFDYLGCGDSEGDFTQGSLAQWIEDIHAAIEEIRERSGLTRVCLVGLRAGAVLALRAAVGRRDINAVVLWDPVLNGKLYLGELADAQRRFLNGREPDAGEYDEILGFPMTPELRHELEMISPECLVLPSSVRLLALANGDEPINGGELLDHFLTSNPHADIHAIPDQPKVWKKFYSRVTPAKALRYMVGWIDRVQS